MRLGVYVLVLGLLTFAVGCAGDDDAAGSATKEDPETTVEQPTPTSEQPTTTSEPTEAEPGDGRSLRLVEVVSGLESPVHLTPAPGQHGRLYIVEQVGLIRVIEGGRLVQEPFLDIQEKVVSGGEQGLLSVAFHPDYAQNRLIYVNYTDTEGDTVVEEYRARGGAAPERVRELLHVDQPYSNHNGGQLVFGPDGLLYVGMGDGGGAGDPENRAQDLGDRLGKLLRVDVDRGGAEWEIVGYGLRNPWRFSFDRETGELWIGDVGQGELEEIDFLPAGRSGLVNYGWDVFEGSQVFEDKEPNPEGRLVGPIAEYTHSEGCSVTGGFVYRGVSVPAASGRYFYGDYCSGFVWSLVERRGEASSVLRTPFEVPALTSFGEDARGELYLVSHEGTVYRLVSR
jgi:glucose/arabinose dehydrogenase